MRCWRDERGFTLAELLVAFAMLVLVLGGVLAIHSSALQAYVAGSNRTEVQQGARVALERVAREIRKACLPPGGQAVTEAASNSLTFMTTDGAGACTVAVTYTGTAIANTLTRNGEVVVGGVRALTFAYWDVNGAATNTAANVRRVDITIETQTEDPLVAGRGGASDVRSHIVASARIRNL
jgi:type II secretory pathway component PulJ